MTDPRRLLTERELEAARGLAVDFLRYDRRGRRLIPYIQIGRSIRYRLDQVDAALDRMVVGGNSPSFKKSSRRGPAGGGAEGQDHAGRLST